MMNAKGVSAETADISVQSFEQMTDNYMKQVLEEYKVAGAAVSVVKDGRLFMKKGYGYADIRQKIPVDADLTAFQIASISKLFTATAAMQLVDEGKLSLSQDINTYLPDLKIKNRYSEPVTLLHLLSHTAGFDYKLPLYYKSSGARYYDSIKPLEFYLKKDMPQIIREPGTFCEYSIYGMALAGYLVERASGVPVHTYITDHILAPLGMNHSSYWLTREISKRMAKPYIYLMGNYLEGAYTLSSNHPCAAICATASDMAGFMLMHLNNGQYNGIRILKPETAAAMHRRHYASDDKLTGTCLGFFEYSRNGNIVIEHGGYLPSFSSLLTLMPEQHIGMFIAINTLTFNSNGVCSTFADKFYDFFTGRPPEKKKVDTAADINFPAGLEADKISGAYILDPYTHDYLLKTKSLFTLGWINCSSSGNLIFSFMGIKKHYMHTGNALFYCSEDNSYCKFSIKNRQVILSMMSFDYEKMPIAIVYLFYIIIAGTLVFSISTLFHLIYIIKNRKSENRKDLIVRGFYLALSLLMVLYMGLNGIMGILFIMADTIMIIHVLKPLINMVCYASLLLTIIAGVLLINSWIQKIYPTKTGLFYSALTTFAVTGTVFMFFMNGFK